MRIIPRVSAMASTRTLSPYHNWTREELIARLHQLEDDPGPRNSTKDQEPFSFSSHSRRNIALKFCYAGSEYNGLAFQKDYTPLPTVEGVLFDALVRTRLIDPDKGFEGCQWDRCGRTDRGVSAAGQVVSLWVRSTIGTSNLSDTTVESDVGAVPSAGSSPVEEPTDDIDLPLMADLDPPFSSCVHRAGTTSSEEISYVQVLNRVLPSTIRVICWSPVSEAFSARFSCQFRHYKYFFPASPDLDISRMRDGAARLVGTHDFRNLCTLDGSKQIQNYKRDIRRADISLVGPDGSSVDAGAMHVFDLVGNAFLYNQVRSIMAVLFLVGSGLEQPHVISSLLNVDPRNPLPSHRPGEPIHVVDRKPSYQMADGLPLVLWECGYSPEDVEWRTDDISIPSEGGQMANHDAAVTTNLRHQMLSLYNRSRISSELNAHFLRTAANHHSIPYTPLPFPPTSKDSPLQLPQVILNIPVGGGMYIRTAKYKPLLQRERGESADVVNERWRLGRGKKRWGERLVKQGRSTDADE